MSAPDKDWPWDVLDLPEVTHDARAIRRAYSRQLKALDARDVTAFQSLRQAYEFALAEIDFGPSDRVARGPIVPPVRDLACDIAGDAAMARAGGETFSNDGARLLSRVEGLLTAQVYLPDDWIPVLASMIGIDGDTALRIERKLLQRIDDAQLHAPPAAWRRLLDNHFGWRQDGVRLLQRFGTLPTATQRILDAESVFSAPKRPQVDGRLILWWLGLTVVVAVVNWLS